MGSGCDLLNKHSERDWQADVQAVTLLNGQPVRPKRISRFSWSSCRYSSHWQCNWASTWSDAARRGDLAQQARLWSDKVLDGSGILDT